MGNEVAILLWRNYPTLVAPRFDFVFFKTRRMVSWETLSMYSSSTTFSANSLNDHREKPSGGSLQLSAMRCASKSPSAFLAYIRLPFFPFNVMSRPSSMNRFLTRSIFLMPILRTLESSSLVERFCWKFPSSQPSSSKAFITFCDL